MREADDHNLLPNAIVFSCLTWYHAALICFLGDYSEDKGSVVRAEAVCATMRSGPRAQ